MSDDSLLSGDNAIMEVLKSSPLMHDRTFRECVEKDDVDGAVVRSDEIAGDENFKLGVRLPAQLVRGQVQRMRSLVASVSEDITVAKAQNHLS